MTVNKDSCLRIFHKGCRPKRHIKVLQQELAGQTAAATWPRPLMVAWLALTLGACASLSAPPPQASPGLVVPAEWANANAQAAAGNPSLLRWWQRFDDPLLGQLISQALVANNSVQGVQAALRQARALHDVAAAGLWPSLGSSASAQRSRRSDNTDNSFQLGLDANWELDVFGAKRSAVSASEASAQASAASLGTVQVSIAAEVALNYIALRSAQERLGMASANLASQSETLQLTQWRLQAGLVTSLEAEQASAATEQTAAQLPALQTSIAQTRHALAVLTGQPPAALALVLAEAGPLPQAASSLTLAFPAETLRQRSDVQAAEFQLAAAAARVAQADAAMLPSFKLGGSLGLSALTLGALTDGASVAAAVLASASWSLFDGGAAQAQGRAQRAAFDQARATYQATLLTALQEVEDALVATRYDRERLLRLQNAFASADIAATLASQRYSSGLVDFQAVLETQRSRLSTQDGVASARAAVSADHVRLYKALGGGWLPSDANATAFPATPLLRTPNS
jgi:NodT family efflux transporter outer membrane factor (OMF) lipoprotein